MWQQSVTPSIRGRLEERNDICVMQFSTKTAQGVIIFYMTEADSQKGLRFLRHHVDKCNMTLNSHLLVANHEGQVWIVPEEGPPIDQQGQPKWPLGWPEGVTTEMDILDLLSIPRRQPRERSAL
eukprot:jgi/Astpho2/8481/Aster-x1522